MHMYRGKNTSNIHASCMHKEKRATNIGVVRIYGEGEKGELQKYGCCQIMWREKKERSISAQHIARHLYGYTAQLIKLTRLICFPDIFYLFEVMESSFCNAGDM